MRKKLTKFFNLIKNDKKTRFLTIFSIVTLFIFTLGYSLSIFSEGTKKDVANIKVNDLSFNMTTNSGTSDDRILHLQANKKERFNIVLTNLNKVNTKYEFIYELCNNSSCTSTSTNIPNTIIIGKKDSNTEINGTINSNNKKEIVIVTNNTSSTDYYIKLSLNAGYDWNDLALSNQINDVIDGNITNIIAYVDGKEVQKFPSTCAYNATIKTYINNKEVTNTNNTIKCDYSAKTWNTYIEGYADKVIVNFTSTTVVPTTFADDSWETINQVVLAGKGYVYPVGSEKEVTINGTSYTVRVANNTTPSECNQEGFSQSACGFVVEFVDIFTTTQKMYESQSNKGGWETSTLRGYLNGTFYNLLPDDLKNAITFTNVVSGHGTTSGENNFTTKDLIYLPSAKELIVDSSKSVISTQDSAFENTRQLDYYQNIGLRASYDYLIKYKVGTTTATAWWLRTARKTTNTTYLSISTAGAWTATSANSAIGIAPTFRIGKSKPFTVIEFISSLHKSSNGLEVDDTDDQNLRYVGSTPNNYISFNDETWRIIGIFNVYNNDTKKNEKLVKIIRNDSLGYYAWDTSDSSINSGYGINEWSQAKLMNELNTDYLDTSKISGTTTWYNGENNLKNAVYSYDKNIKKEYIDKIANVRWNLGGSNSYSNSAKTFYTLERGTTHISNPSDGIARTNTWDGKIALMYPSDYGYASTNTSCRNSLDSIDSSSNGYCMKNNWLFNSAYQWTLSPRSSSAYVVFYVRSDGSVTNNVAYFAAVGVRPVLFLKSDILIAGGEGTQTNPYDIG